MINKLIEIMLSALILDYVADQIQKELYVISRGERIRSRQALLSNIRFIIWFPAKTNNLLFIFH